MAEISDRDAGALAGLVSKYGAAEVGRTARAIERANTEPEPEAGPPLGLSLADESVAERAGCDLRVLRRMDDRTTFRDYQRIKREGGAA